MKNTSESEAKEQIERSWAQVEPTVPLKRASALSGIGERELRRLVDEGSIFASQNRPNTRGSTLRISKASLIDYLARTIR
jgi:hypothetical protein